MWQNLRLQAGVGVLNLLRRVEVEVEVEVEGSLSAAAACSVLEGRKHQTRGILRLPPAGRAGEGLGWPLLHIYLHEITFPPPRPQVEQIEIGNKP